IFWKLACYTVFPVTPVRAGKLFALASWWVLVGRASTRPKAVVQHRNGTAPHAETVMTGRASLRRARPAGKSGCRRGSLVRRACRLPRRRGREKTRGRAAGPAVWRVRSAASFFCIPQADLADLGACCGALITKSGPLRRRSPHFGV